jgi:hypothetical protein
MELLMQVMAECGWVIQGAQRRLIAPHLKQDGLVHQIVKCLYFFSDMLSPP